MINVHNLSYEYPGKKAIDNISFSTRPGSIIAVVGPNGAGKTTLFKCLTTLLRPMRGTIEIDSIDIIKNPLAAKRIIGYLPDVFGLYDQLTVAQVFHYFANAHGVSKNEISQRVQEIASELNLTDKLNEECSKLSRGMRQRVAIGQAIIHQPKLLVLDEPASGLDPEARHDLAQLFLHLKSTGISIIVSSHILAELDHYADDLLVFKDGRLVSEELSSMEQKGKTQKLVVRIAHGIENLQALFGVRYDGTSLPESLQCVQDWNVDGNLLKLEFNGGMGERHQLLKEIINSDCLVEEFYEERLNLQDRYLNMVKQ